MPFFRIVGRAACGCYRARRVARKLAKAIPAPGARRAFIRAAYKGPTTILAMCGVRWREHGGLDGVVWPTSRIRQGGGDPRPGGAMALAVPGWTARGDGRPAAGGGGRHRGGVRSMPADVVSGAGGHEPRSARGAGSGAEPGPGLPRRRLLLAGAGLVSAAGLGAVVRKARRSDAARPPGAATREPPARRSAIWQAKLTVPRPQVIAATDGVVCVAGDDGVYFNPGTAHDVVQALNARDGSYRWTFTIRTGGARHGRCRSPGHGGGPGVCRM